MDFSADEAASVAIELDGSFVEKIAEAKSSAEGRAAADGAMFSALLRLLSDNGAAARSSFMLRHIKREIIFRALCGSCGVELIESLAGCSNAGEIYLVNDWIKKNFRSSFKIEELAKKRSMSVSQLHQKFKNAVGMGPLQCQKKLRLTEARRLMLDEGKSVTEAAMSVGYESVSQFIRDYRKLFDESPKRAAANFREFLEK